MDNHQLPNPAHVSQPASQAPHASQAQHAASQPPHAQHAPQTHQAPHLQNQPAYGTYPSDEIDLVELVAMAWRLRYATVAGAALGLLGGLGFVSVRASTYETTVPVTILRDSLPANTDSKKVVELYTSALGSPDFAAAAFQSLAKTAPQFEANLKAANLTVNDLVRRQTALENVGKPNNALIKLVVSASSSDFFITTKLPIRGLDSDARTAILAAMNSAGNAFNARETENYTAQAKGALAEASKTVSAAISSQEQAMASAFVTQVRIKGELAEIEYGLQRMAGAESVNFARLTQVSPVSVVVNNTGGADVKTPVDNRSGVSAADFERVSRLKAILVHDKRMTPQQSGEIDLRLARLQVKAQRMRAELEPLISSMESGREALTKAQRAALTPIDRATAFVPLFAFDTATTPAEAATLKTETPAGKLLPVVGGAFLGAMFGFFAMALFKFIRKNQSRLASLLSAE